MGLIIAYLIKKTYLFYDLLTLILPMAFPATAMMAIVPLCCKNIDGPLSQKLKTSRHFPTQYRKWLMKWMGSGGKTLLIFRLSHQFPDLAAFLPLNREGRGRQMILELSAAHARLIDVKAKKYSEGESARCVLKLMWAKKARLSSISSRAPCDKSAK